MIPRNVLVKQSTQIYGKKRLEERGWTSGKLEVLESFPYTDSEWKGDVSEKSYLAFGYNFDDDGRPAEMGSDLTTRVYTLEFFVFAANDDLAEQIANDLKFAIDTDSIVPLLDLEDPEQPQFDALIVNGVKAQRVLVEDPEPFQENVWLTTARVEDTYSTALA